MYLRMFLCFLSIAFITPSIAQTPVTVTSAENILFYPERSAPAEVVALNNSFIPAEISATVKTIHVNVGDKVDKGAILVSLDCEKNALLHQLELAKLTQLEHQVAFAVRELKRGEALAETRNIGEAELDNRENVANTSQAQLSSQQAAVALAKLHVKRCQITAPFTGIVTKRLANEGEMIDIGKPVIALLEENNLAISSKISQADLTSFSAAARYLFVQNNQNYAVTLKHLLPFIEKNNRSQEARFHFNQQSAIAGSIGRLVWISPKAYLPAYLFVKRNGTSGYFIAENNKAKFIAVENAEEGRPLTFALNKQTQIIIEGRHGLVDGEEISITNNKVTN